MQPLYDSHYWSRYGEFCSARQIIIVTMIEIDRYISALNVEHEVKLD